VSDAKQFTGVSQSGAGGSRATQTGSPKGEESGSEQIKMPYNTQKAVKPKPPLPLTAKNANGTVAQIYAEVRKSWA
jgi:hypothetical protein